MIMVNQPDYELSFRQNSTKRGKSKYYTENVHQFFKCFRKWYKNVEFRKKNEQSTL